jgi:hypothetical protein
MKTSSLIEGRSGLLEGKYWFQAIFLTPVFAEVRDQGIKIVD